MPRPQLDLFCAAAVVSQSETCALHNPLSGYEMVKNETEKQKDGERKCHETKFTNKGLLWVGYQNLKK